MRHVNNAMEHSLIPSEMEVFQSIWNSDKLFTSIQAMARDLSGEGCDIIHVALREDGDPTTPQIIYDRTPQSVMLEVRAAALEPTAQIAQMSRTFGRPFLVSSAEHMREASPLERTYMLQLLDAGHGSIICCPINLGPVAGHVLLGIKSPLKHETSQTAYASRLYQLLLPLFQRHPPQRLLRLARELTAQEARILSLTSDGFTEKEIAANLTLSPHTIRVHVENAKRKLGARNKPHAVALFLATT